MQPLHNWSPPHGASSLAGRPGFQRLAHYQGSRNEVMMRFARALNREVAVQTHGDCQCRTRRIYAQQRLEMLRILQVGGFASLSSLIARVWSTTFGVDLTETFHFVNTLYTYADFTNHSVSIRRHASGHTSHTLLDTITFLCERWRTCMNR